MADPSSPPEDTESVLASLEGLRGRIEAAQAGAPVGGRGGGSRVSRRVWLLSVAALVVAVLVGVLVVRSGDGNDADVAAGDATTAQPVTTGVPAPTSLPSTPVVPTTTVVVPSTPTTAPATTAQPSGTDDPDRPPGVPTGEVVVAPGDSFWTIAVRAATERVGRDPTVAEITAVWVPFVVANADRLVEPGNADLIFVGQVLVLPAGAASP